MKKAGQVILITLILGFILLSFVSAIDPNPSTLTSEQVQATAAQGAGIVKGAFSGIVQGFLGPLFGSEQFLPRTFLFIILFLLVYSIVPAIFGEKTWLNLIVSVCITALAMLGIPPGFVESMVTGYGVMGTVILSVIPFIIVMIFSIRVKGLISARIVWIAYVLFYFFMYVYGWVNSAKAWNDPTFISYLAAIVLGIAVFFFVPGIKKAWFKGEMTDIELEGDKIIGKAKLLHKLQSEELKGGYGDGSGI